MAMGTSSGRPAIFVFDDHGETTELIGEILEERGFAATLATDPAEAIARLEREAFSLVLADFLIGSPEASERVAADLLRAAGPTPVGCITAWRVPEPLKNAYAFVLTKPFGIETLLHEVVRSMRTGEVDDRAAELMRRYFAALTEQRWSELGSLCCDDVQYIVPGHHRLSTTIVGRNALESYTAHAFRGVSETRFELGDAFVLPRGAMARYTGRWTGRHGESTTTEGAVLFTFADGKISTIGIRVDPDRFRANPKRGA
jgi:CheY-like chemotaxis protein